MGKRIIISVIAVLVILGGFFYFRCQVYYSHGSFSGTKIFKIEKGERNTEIASKLKEEGLISGKIYFYYYLRSRGIINRILPGEYEISGSLAVPEIALIITEEKNRFIKVTFPEGWTSSQMAERLLANRLPGDKFLEIVKNPGGFREKYEFLSDKETKSLEGYLFPDTYFFAKDEEAESIVRKMLGIFNAKITPEMRAEIKNQNKDIHEIVTMASIIEGEVKSEEDRKIVSGIFWKRIKNGKLLQSCATLAIVLGEKKKQYSFEDTRAPSPYNTYLNKSLPPGPISNPGLSSIEAAIYPKISEYNYFLSDPETGKTVFSKTIEEHNANKVKYGL